MDRSIDRQHAIDRLFHPLATRDQTRPCYRSSHISFQLASGPMRIFARGVKLANVPQFNARMTPIRANIVGPPDVATRIKASIAACHSAAWCSAFGSLVMYLRES